MSTAKKPEVADELVTSLATVWERAPTSAEANEQRAKRFLQLVTDFVIDGPDTYQEAATEHAHISQAWTDMEADRTSFTQPLNALLKRLNARYQPHLLVLEQAKKLLAGKMSTWHDHQERLRREEAQRAEAAAAAERKRLADEAEALRVAEEKRQQAAAAEAQRLADVAAAARTKKAREAAEREAAELRAQEEQRQAQAAEQIAAVETTAAVVTAVTPATPVAVAAGVGTAKVLKITVIDKHALARFIVTEKAELLTVLEVKEQLLLNYVRALGGVGVSIPGVRIEAVTQIRGR